MLLLARLAVAALSLFLAVHLLHERRRGGLSATVPASAALTLLALSVMADAVAAAGPQWLEAATRWSWGLRAIAPALWLDAALAILPSGSRSERFARVVWRRGLLPMMLVLGGLVAGTSAVVAVAGDGALIRGTPLRFWPGRLRWALAPAHSDGRRSSRSSCSWT